MINEFSVASIQIHGNLVTDRLISTLENIFDQYSADFYCLPEYFSLRNATGRCVCAGDSDSAKQILNFIKNISRKKKRDYCCWHCCRERRTKLF